MPVAEESKLNSKFDDDSNPIPGNTLTADRRYDKDPMNTKLYVGNLAFSISEDVLRETFGQFGVVTEVHIASDRLTGRPRGFGFITMGTADEMKVAIEKLNGVELEGRALTVNEAKPREDAGGGSVTAGGRTYTSPNRKAGAFQARGNRRH